MEEAKPTSTPVEVGLKFNNDDDFKYVVQEYIDVLLKIRRI